MSWGATAVGSMGDSSSEVSAMVKSGREEILIVGDGGMGDGGSPKDVTTGVTLGSRWSLVVGFGLLVLSSGGGGGRPSHPCSRNWITSWDFALVPAFSGREHANLYQLWPPVALLRVVMVLEKLEAAGDNCRIDGCCKCGSCYLE